MTRLTRSKLTWCACFAVSSAVVVLSRTSLASALGSNAEQPQSVPPATASHTGGRSPVDPSGSVASLGTPTGVNAAAQAADAVDNFAKTNYPGVYAGVFLSDRGNTLNVRLVDPASDVEAAITRVAQEQSPEIRPNYIRADVTVSELNEIDATVEKSIADLRAQGIQLVVWGINLESGTEALTVYHLDEATAKVLHSRFGPNLTLTNSDKETITTFGTSS